MTTSFRPANSPLPTPEVKVEDMATPTTPRPATASEAAAQAQAQARAQSSSSPSLTNPLADDATTPTRASFGAALASQKPLPSSPFPQAVQVPESADTKPTPKTPKRENSQHSRKSGGSDDVDMDESDGQGDGGEEGAAGSDDDSASADGSRNKKKKSQRFYCTDFPPCNLSFTRSEHLARHIRKHTGERPFQCHCSRRFSRLDNLRQHAQTVHVNEDIPMDSLAATGSRYQRQMRTERVRPTAGRARAATTAGSLTAPVRGHSKSLSTSSINSVTSVASSVLSPRDEYHRHRPPPLVMSNHSARLSTDSYRSIADSNYSYRHPSPSDFSAPTSATLSTNQSSPRWSCMASPTSQTQSLSHSHSRSQSMFASNRERRLSVPSGSPFPSPHGLAPVAGSPMASGHHLTPPQADYHGRRDSLTADDAYRRRTWHPDTRQIQAPTSNLSSVANSTQYQINPPAPLADPRPSTHAPIRLPGIESFDRPSTPPRRAPSPMMVDTEMGNSPLQHQVERDLHKLEISKTTPPRDGAGAWAHEAERAVQAQAEHSRLNAPTVRFEHERSMAAPAGYPHQHQHQHQPQPQGPLRSFHQHTLSAPVATPRGAKRHGWYNGPIHSDDLRADPRTARVERMVHPNIAGWKPQLQPQMEPRHEEHVPENNMLNVLVAVATNEGNPSPRRPY